MALYRFRVQIDDYDDIYRDIDILSSQTFEDFHHIIQESFQFDKKHAASFFTSDDHWRKGLEITLREEDLALNEEDRKRNISKKYLMQKTKISSFINQPHQKFLYVFDPIVKWEFMIELIKITSEEQGKKYPLVWRKVGNPPKQYKSIPNAKTDLPSPELKLSGLLSPDDISEDEIYKAIAEDNFEIPDPDEMIHDKISPEISTSTEDPDMPSETFSETDEDNSDDTSFLFTNEDDDQ